jgi:hypothetical protein
MRRRNIPTHQSRARWLHGAASGGLLDWFVHLLMQRRDIPRPDAATAADEARAGTDPRGGECREAVVFP